MDLPAAVAGCPRATRRVYRILRRLSSPAILVLPAKIVTESGKDKEGELSIRAVGRALKTLRDELKLVMSIPGRGYCLGQEPDLFNSAN